MPRIHHLLPLAVLFLLTSLLVTAQTTAQTATQTPAAQSTQPPIVRKQLMLARFDARPVSRV
ncbi:MAG TPA: hypothetical protein VIM64_22765, partial [Puia sp.]